MTVAAEAMAAAAQAEVRDLKAENERLRARLGLAEDVCRAVGYALMYDHDVRTYVTPSFTAWEAAGLGAPS